MAEHSTTRRRDIQAPSALSGASGLKGPFTLAEVLLILAASSYQKMLLPLQDPISMSTRALIMVELALRGAILVREDKVVEASQSYSMVDALHDEVYSKIKNSKRAHSADEWLSLLNGESFSYRNSRFHVKHTRRRIGKILIGKGIFRRPRGRQLGTFLSVGATLMECDLANREIKSEIIKGITSYSIEDRTYSVQDELRMHSILCALSFCCMIDDILLTLTLSIAEQAQGKIREVISRYKGGMGNTENKTEWSVFCILKAYLRIGTWV